MWNIEEIIISNNSAYSGNDDELPLLQPLWDHYLVAATDWVATSLDNNSLSHVYFLTSG